MAQRTVIELNAAKLREALSIYVGAARKTGGRRGRPRGGGAAVKTDKEQLQAAREWLRAQSHEVSNRGRIKAELMDLYNAATGRGQA